MYLIEQWQAVNDSTQHNIYESIDDLYDAVKSYKYFMFLVRTALTQKHEIYPLNSSTTNIISASVWPQVSIVESDLLKAIIPILKSIGDGGMWQSNNSGDRTYIPLFGDSNLAVQYKSTIDKVYYRNNKNQDYYIELYGFLKK